MAMVASMISSHEPVRSIKLHKPIRLELISHSTVATAVKKVKFICIPPYHKSLATQQNCIAYEWLLSDL